MTRQRNKPPEQPQTKKITSDAMRRAANKARQMAEAVNDYKYPLKMPDILAGVVPQNRQAAVLAMDDATVPYSPYIYSSALYGSNFVGFPGFPYLSQLATRAEFRALASTYSTEMVREWIKINSTQNDDKDNSEKIKQIEAEFKRLNIKGLMQKVSEHDCLFGRGQIFIGIKGADKKTPLILDPRTVKIGSLDTIVPVEAIWTTPSMYNALDPAAPDFYRPNKWFMLGQEVHASRLLTVVTRPLPDMLKPAFNFAGMSLSQLAEPYVNNWLRTRQSVADLINNFSITAMQTDMAAMLQSGDMSGSGQIIFDRADFFTSMRSNKGLMILDKDKEALVQLNVPLGGLHELQAQAQEQMCSISKIPAVILTGLSPSGMNASTDGEIRTFYDWIAAQQESFYREPLEIIFKVVQLNLYGEIDPDINFTFNPLYQMTSTEQATVRLQNMQAAQGYITMGALSGDEVRKHLADDPESGWNGIDAELSVAPPNNFDPSQEEDPGQEEEPDADKGKKI